MSKYKTRPIGEIFEYRGIKLQVVENDNCIGCYVYWNDDCLKYHREIGSCSGLFRDDQKNVIFKRIIE